MNKALLIRPKANKPMIAVRVQKQRLERFRAALKKNKHSMTDVIETAIDLYLKEYT